MSERIFPRWFVGFVLTGVVSSLAFVLLAVSFSPGSSPAGSSSMNGYSHATLEQDRVMTEQMAVQSSMGEDGMLQRSQDPAYIRALEEHIRQFDAMLGLTP